MRNSRDKNGNRLFKKGKKMKGQFVEPTKEKGKIVETISEMKTKL